MTNRTKAEQDKFYAEYHSRPDQIAKRSQRNKARRLMEKEVGKAALKGKDINHKTPIRSGGSNARSNLEISSVAKNRGWEKKR